MAEGTISRAFRREIAERAAGLCEYCRSPSAFAPDLFEIEHVQPRSAGGPTTLANLAWACGGCNLFKAAKTNAIDPDSGQRVSLFHPREDVWAAHFEWSNDFSRIIGKTPSGRATIAALRMNRPSLVNLRMALLSIGKHPPEHG
jgi:hypothetical protein